MADAWFSFILTFSVGVATLSCCLVLLSLRRLDRLTQIILKDQQYQLNNLVIEQKKKRGRPKKEVI
jgi:hypothetical protein